MLYLSKCIYHFHAGLFPLIPIKYQHNIKGWGQNQCIMLLNLIFDLDPLLKNGSRAPAPPVFEAQLVFKDLWYISSVFQFRFVFGYCSENCTGRLIWVVHYHSSALFSFHIVV